LLTAKVLILGSTRDRERQERSSNSTERKGNKLIAGQTSGPYFYKTKEGIGGKLKAAGEKAESVEGETKITDETEIRPRKSVYVWEKSESISN